MRARLGGLAGGGGYAVVQLRLMGLLLIPCASQHSMHPMLSAHKPCIAWTPNPSTRATTFDVKMPCPTPPHLCPFSTASCGGVLPVTPVPAA